MSSSKKSISSLRVIALGLGALLTTSGLTACNDHDVATAIGAAAIVGGAVVIANNTHCVSGYVTRCTDYVNYRGYTVRECRDYYDSCAYIAAGRRGYSLNDATPDYFGTEGAEAAVVVQPATVVVTEDRVNEVNWAVAFNMGFEPAEKLITAFKEARDGDIGALKELGLTKKDMRRFGSYKMPSQKSIETIAQNIDQDTATTKRVFRTLIDSARDNASLR